MNREAGTLRSRTASFFSKPPMNVDRMKFIIALTSLTVSEVVAVIGILGTMLTGYVRLVNKISRLDSKIKQMEKDLAQNILDDKTNAAALRELIAEFREERAENRAVIRAMADNLERHQRSIEALVNRFNEFMDEWRNGGK